MTPPVRFIEADDSGDFETCGFPVGSSQLSVLCVVPRDPEPFSGEVWTGALEIEAGQTFHIGTLTKT
jgi:hypothetical protein